MTSRAPARGWTPADDAARALRRGVRELRDSPWLEQAYVTALGVAYRLAAIASTLARRLRRVAIPALRELGRRTRSAAAQAAGSVREAFVRGARRPGVALYAGAVAAAVVAGWIVGDRV